jgi:hypothetical protein
MWKIETHAWLHDKFFLEQLLKEKTKTKTKEWERTNCWVVFYQFFKTFFVPLLTLIHTLQPIWFPINTSQLGTCKRIGLNGFELNR